MYLKVHLILMFHAHVMVDHFFQLLLSLYLLTLMPILLQVESLNQLMLQVLTVEIVDDDEVIDELTTDAVDYVDNSTDRLMPCTQGLMTALFVRAHNRCC